jgi:tetratricopeptide (TPR) repeat protein
MNHYRQGLKFDPEHEGCKVAYRNLKKYQGSIKIAIMIIVSIHYNINIDMAILYDIGLMTKSDVVFRGEKWDESVKYLTQLTNTDSKLLNLRANLDLAVAYRKLNRFSEAKECAKKVIQFDNKNPEGYRRLADVSIS